MKRSDGLRQDEASCSGSAEWRDLVRRLRAHVQPDVAYTARLIGTAEE